MAIRGGSVCITFHHTLTCFTALPVQGRYKVLREGLLAYPLTAAKVEGGVLCLAGGHRRAVRGARVGGVMMRTAPLSAAVLVCCCAADGALRSAFGVPQLDIQELTRVHVDVMDRQFVVPVRRNTCCSTILKYVSRCMCFFCSRRVLQQPSTHHRAPSSAPDPHTG